MAGRTSKLDNQSRRRLMRTGLIVGNFLLLIIVGLFVLSNRSASQTVQASTLNGAVATASSAPKPLDTLSSAQIALTAAQMADMPELTAIHNQADSDSLLLAVVPNDSSTLAKPQIVATALKSKQDIVDYVTKPGDTVASLSSKFNVTADSIRWSNNLSGNNLTVGLKLVIPPVNGIVYTVKAGDTAASLAAKYHTDEGQLIGYNDAEINGLQVGERIIIPNGTIVAQPVYTASVSTFGGFSFGGGAIYGYNGYDFGTCTWYVASQITVPANWGNANTWAAGALASGWTVSSRPTVGAIAQTGGMSYFGHVAIVTGVSPDGSQIEYRDMNDPYWDVVTNHGWAPATTFEHYITH